MTTVNDRGPTLSERAVEQLRRAIVLGELEAGDLAQVDPDGGWVVITEYPEADGDDVYLEYTDRFTGEPATCTISAQEMVPTMHVMQEEN